MYLQSSDRLFVVVAAVVGIEHFRISAHSDATLNDDTLFEQLILNCNNFQFQCNASMVFVCICVFVYRIGTCVDFIMHVTVTVGCFVILNWPLPH